MSETIGAFTVDEIRQDFPYLTRRGRAGGPIAYFDASATSQKPSCVIDAVTDFYRHHNGAVHRGTHVLSDDSTQLYEDARATVARFIKARPDEVGWTKNATEALNIVAYAMTNGSAGDSTGHDVRFSLQAGDRVVISRAEHHSNLVPWQLACQRSGAELKWLDLDPEGRIDLDTLDVITPNTKVVAVTHASNVTGAITPIEPIIQAAHNVGALVVLDTCQSSAHLPIDVTTLGADFIALSSHKMCGPTGIGALWSRRDLLEAMPPVLTGGSTVASVTMDSTEFLPAPDCFEAGSQPVAQAVGWARALEYISTIGMDAIARREEELATLMLEGLSDIEGVKILGPTSTHDRLAVVAWTMDGVHPHDVGQFLDSREVAVRVGHHCAIPLHQFFGERASTRATATVTTTRAEIDQLVDAVSATAGFFTGA